MGAVPRLLPSGGTVVCLGGGPSLLVGDVEQCRGKATVIVINDTYRLAPWADVLYACDPKWWSWHPAAASFAGLKFGIRRGPQYPIPFPDGVITLANTGETGLESDPSGVRVGINGGANSGYQAINIAAHLGATRILLLGYDMKPRDDGRTHWHGGHPETAWPQWELYQRAFDSLPDALKARGIDLVNCSRATALTQFRRYPIERLLSSDPVAA